MRLVGSLIWPVALVAMVAGLYSSSPKFTLLFVLVLLGTIFVSKTPKLKMHVVDWTIVSIAMFELIALAASSYTANSLGAAILPCVAALIFLVVRMTVRQPVQVAWLVGAFGVCGASLGIEGLRRFSGATRRLSEAGFTNLLPFRSQLIVPPSPWIPGEWFTLVLLALPFACALPVYLWLQRKPWPAVVALISPFLVSSVLVVSLSRAAFWSTILFCVSACTLMIISKSLSLRSGGLLLAGALSALLLIMICESAIYPGIFKAYVGEHTSQTRSTEGRVEIWNRSMALIRAHPLLGVGSANSALMLLSSADEFSNLGCGHPRNTPDVFQWQWWWRGATRNWCTIPNTRRSRHSILRRQWATFR